MRKSDKKLAQVYNYIKDYCLEHCYPPTYAEIAEELGGGTSSIFYYVRRLIAEGYLETDSDKNGMARSYRLAGYRLTPVSKVENQGGW